MRATLRHSCKLAAAALCVSVVSLSAAGAASGAETCQPGSMYVVAHQDDDLLFQSPALLRDIQSGRCVRTVYLTAGDAGEAEPYWAGREEGEEAAYAQMAGVEDEWTESTIAAAGHSVHLATLDDDPGVSLVFMRLPDGAVSGEGNAAYGFQSLLKLWASAHPELGRPSIPTIAAVDGSATYGYGELIEALAALIDSFEPRTIATQDYSEKFLKGDHPDHTATAYFAREASKLYGKPHRLLAYQGYESGDRPENVFGELLGAKGFAFYTYGAHDSNACSSEAGCSPTPYAAWMKRQYVTASSAVGVIANAGYAQIAAPGATVGLDGSQSASESGDPLEYLWSQAKGPPVALVGGETATPSFLAPSHAAVLHFSLRVRDGATVSAPDTVEVRIPSADPTPHAVLADPATLPSGAAGALDGGESWDPNSLPLQFAWLQTGGPPVELTGSSTPTPSFTAPTGPATLTFSLVVSNGNQASAPATAVVHVLGIAPSFTSDDEAAFVAGEPSSFTVDAEGSPPPALSAAGELPAGVSFADNGDGTATISGTALWPAGHAAAGPYPLVLGAENSEGAVEQHFTLTVLPPPPPRGGPPRGGPPRGGTAPAVMAPDLAYALVGRPFQLAVAVSGSPSPRVSLDDAAPAGLDLLEPAAGGALLRGVPREARTSVISLVAANELGEARHRITLVVDPLPTLSRSRLALPLGRRLRRLVRVRSAAPARTRCLGAPPAGVRCRVRPDGMVVVEGSGAGGRPGVHRLKLRIDTRAGSVVRALTLRLVSGDA